MVVVLCESSGCLCGSPAQERGGRAGDLGVQKKRGEESKLAWREGREGGWQGAWAEAVIFMEKAIKPCSLINGHHQDLFPAQIKLKVMDGAASTGRAGGA